MYPLLQDFLAVVMDTMTMHINPQYKHITMFYWSARLSCCFQESIAKSFSRKYSASNHLSVRGYISVILTVSFPLSEISLSYLLVWLHMLETMIVILVRRTRSLFPLTIYIYIYIYTYINTYIQEYICTYIHIYVCS